jgi:cystathionine beta-lyase
VLTALDNTWGAGLAFAPFNLVPGASPAVAVDVSAHALTKYPSGGGDVLMGSIVTRDEALHQKIKLSHMRLGYGVAANDAELVLRSLPSIGIRYRAADESARQLANWLKARPEVEAVLHPALQDAPGHMHWKNLCRKRQLARTEYSPDATNSVVNELADGGLAAGLFSIVFHEKYSQAQVDAFVDALKLFKIGYSWGGHLSLAVPYDIASMRNAKVAHWPYRGGLVRFSIGFEAAHDLQADLAQAFKAALSAHPSA